MKTLILLAAVSAAASTTALPARVEQLAWMQGCWEQTAAGRTIEEHWTAPRGGILLGLGRTVKNGALLEYEFVGIREQNGRLAYEARPSGQAGAVFLSRVVADRQVVFENPEHDFPNEIGYERKGESLAAWIRGKKGDAVKRIDFEYQRVECAPR
jgi:hypothetical protein